MSTPPAPVDETVPGRACCDVGLDEKVRALRCAVTYDDRPQQIESIETHFAWIFFAGETAYKLKKPISNEYVDLTTVAARRFNCDEEVRLNRRLAPDVYLGISSLTCGSDGLLRIDGAGEVVDWLVRMRRLPSASMLDRAIAAGTASSSCLRAVGRALARFYATQQPIDIQPADYVVCIANQIRADHKALSAPELQLDPTRVQLALTSVWSAFSCLESKLSARARERRIVEAHGDLRPEHICLSDPPRVIDALEFSLDLRTLDPAEELAFLCLECDRAGGKWAGKEILSSYLQESADPVCEQLLQFYRSRRAMVRAKLVAWHLCDPLYRALAPWSELAHSYLDIATLCARQALAEPSAAGLR